MYRLSDVQLEQGLTRGFLFRKVCHLEPGRGVPDATTLGRFRTGLGDRIEGLFGEVVRALSAQNLILAEGRIASVDVEGPPAMGSRAAGGGSRRQGAGCARATLRRVSM